MFHKNCLVCSSEYDSTKTFPEDEEIQETEESAIITETLINSILQLPNDKQTTKSSPGHYNIWACGSCSSKISTLYKLLEKLKLIQKEVEDNKERLLESIISSVIKSCANHQRNINLHSSSLKQVVSFLPRDSVEYLIYKKWNGRCKKEFAKNFPESTKVELKSSESSSFQTSSICDSTPNETSCSHNEDHCYSSSSAPPLHQIEVEVSPTVSMGDKIRTTAISKQSYPCTKCESVFNRKVKLHEHMSSCHSKDDDEKNLNKATKSKSFTCPENSSFSKVCQYCGESFSSKQLFQAHIQGKKCSKPQNSEKKVKKDVYQCTHCTKTFTNKQSLFYHVTSHTGEKPFKCKFKSCPKSFINQTQLNIHFSSVHTKERNYICQLCGFRVSSLSALSSHLKTHSKTKPFKCNNCEKTFRSRTHLSKHQLIHSGEKPFACSQCNRAFNRKENLKSHLYTHEKLKPHTCSFCPVSFSRAGLLRKHIQDRHSDSMENALSTINIHGNNNTIIQDLNNSNQGQKEAIMCFDNNNPEGVVSSDNNDHSSSAIMPKEIVSILCNIPNPLPQMEFTKSTTTNTNETENALEETLFFTSSNGGQYIILKEVSE